MSQHPPRHEMEAYLQGTLAPESAEPLSQHLGECAECSETVANLEQQSADTFAADLLKRPAAEPFADESQFQKALAELRAGAAELAVPKQPNDERTELLHTRLGEYELLAVLGEGGMGAVYKARHVRLEKLVALKVLAAARMSDPAIVARFQREMKAVGQLRHVNIVAAHDAGEHAGRHFLVMELVEGEDLAKLVKRDGPLPVGRACAIIAQAARGLAYAHAKGIVHRDIKPSNLLVDGEGTLKILDLGLARLVDAPAEAGEGLTSESQIMGTPEYMAPEQAENTAGADARADLYSLGCTLWYLLTGRPPYTGASAMERLFAHRERPIPSLRAALPDAPAELDELLTKLMAKRPEDRPANATEVATALDRISVASSQLLVASDAAPTPTADRRPPTTGFPWLIALGFGGVAAVLAALAIILSIQTPQGTIEVEVSAEAQKDVQLAVKQGGQELEVADAKNGWTITLKEGKYDLAFKAGGDRFEVQDKTIEVRRGDTARVRVALKPAAVAAVPKPVDPPIVRTTASTPASPLDALDPAQIPEVERYPWQPKELVAVIGSHKRRSGDMLNRAVPTPDGKGIVVVGYNVQSFDVASGRVTPITADDQIWIVGTQFIAARPPVFPRDSWDADLRYASITLDGKRVAAPCESTEKGHRIRVWDFVRGELKSVVSKPECLLGRAKK